MPRSNAVSPHRLSVLLVSVVLAASLLTGAGVHVASADGGGITASAAHSAGVLKKGSRGKRVRAVQRALGISADGVFGPRTKRAVKRFQRRRGLAVDGVVGPMTLRALGIRSAPRLPAVLKRIAQCESGGNPRAIGGGGAYRGKYQFTRATWRGLGAKGDPAKASEAKQDRMALKLYRRAGTAPWANCAG